MTASTVRVLTESDWALYRQVRLRALEESPESFIATLAEESDRDEGFWRERMRRSFRLLAEVDSQPQGIVSLGTYAPEENSAECYGLYVLPSARGVGVAWHLVEEAERLATREGYERLYYWVGTDNPRAIGFANNYGFRVTGHRRVARAIDVERGEEEMAMVLPLSPDTTSGPTNPTTDKAVVRGIPG
jgi:GNAT superfamily N-acetyltransferase